MEPSGASETSQNLLIRKIMNMTGRRKMARVLSCMNLDSSNHTLRFRCVIFKCDICKKIKKTFAFAFFIFIMENLIEYDDNNVNVPFRRIAIGKSICNFTYR